MSLTLSDLTALLRLTLTSPRSGLRAVLASGPSLAARLQALLLMAVASALLLHLGLRVSPPPVGNPLIEMLVASPFTSAVVQGVVLAVTAFLIDRLGRAWGGQGSLADAVLAVVWLQAIFVAIQAVQILALMVLPPLASLISLGSLVLFFWLMSHFVAEVHGFASVGKTFLAILVAMLVLSFLMTFILAVILGPEAFANV